VTGRIAAVGLAAALLTPSGAAAQAPACDRAGWEDVAAAHLARYPLLGVEDAYKLLHQGVFGTEHAAPDLASASAMLQDELRTLDVERNEPAPPVEAIAPEGRVVRVHLRPYVAAGGDPDALVVAFLQTAVTVRGQVDELRCAADVVEHLAGSRWSAGVWRGFIDRMLAAGLPAMHHSEPFEAVYRPAYRVVSSELLPTLEPPSR
jgi:hypothetical protein